MAKKKGKKKIRKTLNLKINLEVEQTGYSPARGPARRKRIVSRRRLNLREVRRSMGGPTPANLRNPSFFGNTALLSNAAMAAMNNKAYALENQMREHTAEVKALQMAGQGESQQVKSLQEVNAGLQQQLLLTRGMGQAAYQKGQRDTGAAQAETAQIKAKGRAEAASDEELKYLGVEVMGEGWTPGAFKQGKWKEVKSTLQGLHADRENEELQARFREQMEGTHRAKAVRKEQQDQTAMEQRRKTALALEELSPIRGSQSTVYASPGASGYKTPKQMTKYVMSDITGEPEQFSEEEASEGED